MLCGKPCGQCILTSEQPCQRQMLAGEPWPKEETLGGSERICHCSEPVRNGLAIRKSVKESDYHGSLDIPAVRVSWRAELV